MKKKRTMVSLWGDHIVISSLFIGLAISLLLVAITFVVIELLAHEYPAIASNKKDLIYGFGTLAVLVAFIINNMWIKPQRTILTKADQDTPESEDPK